MLYPPLNRNHAHTPTHARPQLSGWFVLCALVRRRDRLARVKGVPAVRFKISDCQHMALTWRGLFLARHRATWRAVMGCVVLATGKPFVARC